MSHKVKIRIAALVTAVYLGSLSAAGLAVRSDNPHTPPQAAQAAAALPAHEDEHHTEGD
jgi:hypothetical protein